MAEVKKVNGFSKRRRAVAGEAGGWRQGLHAAAAASRKVDVIHIPAICINRPIGS